MRTNSRPLFSIIIPTFNSESYVLPCLRSAINQSLKEIEIIVADDGSTDATIDIVKDLAVNDKRIILIQNAHQGVSKSRNLGIRKASGRYILFLDSDDYLDNDTCKKLGEELGKEEVDVLFFNAKIVDAKNKKSIIKYNNIKNAETPVSFLIENWYWQTGGKAIKRDVVKHFFKTDLQIGEDAVFWIENLKKASTFSYINQPLYYYTSRENSLSSIKTVNKRSVSELDAIKLLIDMAPNKYQAIISEHYINRFLRLARQKTGNFLLLKERIGDLNDCYNIVKKTKDLNALTRFKYSLKRIHIKLKLSRYDII